MKPIQRKHNVHSKIQSLHHHHHICTPPYTHSPHDKRQLVPDTLPTRQGEFEIENGPSTLCLGQFPNKRVKVLVGRRFENNDILLVVGETIDYIAQLFALLELLELFDTLGGLRVSLEWGWFVDDDGHLVMDHKSQTYRLDAGRLGR